MAEGSGIKQLKQSDGLTARAYDELRRAIIEHRLPPGSLTSARALSDLLGISRTPVREALVELGNEGLVAFERNRGVRIAAPESDDIREIFELRLLLEVPVVERTVTSLSKQQIAALRSELDAMAANVDDEAAFMRHDRAYHELLLQLSDNQRLIDFVGSLRDQTRVRGISTVGRSRPLAAILREHRRIHDCVKRGDAAGTAAALADHIENTRELLLAQFAEDPDSEGKQP
jgi:DNA-binding GntR family transcriptional regulator